jgi:hypothetical protein
LCDLDSDTLAANCGRSAIPEASRSLDELRLTGVDAIALFTLRHADGLKAAQALNCSERLHVAGLSAMSIGDTGVLVGAVEGSRRVTATASTQRV